MKRTLRLLLALPVILALGAALVWGWLDATRVSAGGLPPLKTGDLVFQESGNTQSAAIALASRSLYTHVGIVEIDSQGRLFVVEAAGPVRTVALNDWIAHGTAGRITVKRVKGLDDVQARKAIAAAHVYDGRPYDVYFTDDRETLYCSELVHLAFKEGAGLELGAGQRVKDLHIANA
ncbi:MAG: YiiX/YebB-like N1pC/P60 family cysteine hydrolase, partial [Hyphomicrobium sp.]